METRSGRFASILDVGERILESQTTRLILSFLIVLSVLPEARVSRLVGERGAAILPWLLIAVFAPEVLLRVTVVVNRLRERRARLGETAVVVLDIFALISFLPLHQLGMSAQHLRLFRLARLLLLVGYWGRTMRELAAILARRDRRGQVTMVLLSGLLLSSTAAVVLTSVDARWDFDGNGVVDEDDQSFLAILWWSFRQVEDPGNLVEQPQRTVVVAVSVLLTFSGLLLFSFLVGVGTGAVDELLERSRAQPVGLRNHTVVLGIDHQIHFLLGELADIYRKNFGAMKAAALGREPDLPESLRTARLRSLRYRVGESDRIDDLERMDLNFAKRVLILGPTAAHDPDAHVVSSVLAARSISSSVDLFPVLEHEKSFAAVRAAGGPRTHVVGAGSFVGFFLAQNVVYPGVSSLYRQLLSSDGCEIYTYVFSPRERAAFRQSQGSVGWLDVGAAATRSFFENGVTLLGVFLSDPNVEDESFDELETILGLWSLPEAHPACAEGRIDPAWIAGIIGISLLFEDLRALVHDLIEHPELLAEARLSRSAEKTEIEPTWRRSKRPSKRVLICGGSARVPRILHFLSESFDGVEATVLIRQESRLSSFRHELEMALEGGFSGATRGTSTYSVRDDGEGFELQRDPESSSPLRVTVRTTDWSDVDQLWRHSSAELARADAILFLPRHPEAEDSDGMVALDCLRMAHFAAQQQIVLKPSCQVVGLVWDAAKGDLLERRLAAVSEGAQSPQFTIVAGERVRQHYIMQNVYVEALHNVYFELMNPRSADLGRITRDEWGGLLASGELQIWDLLSDLEQQGATLVGLELCSTKVGEAPRVLLDPRDLAEVDGLDVGEIRALYVLR